MWQNVVELCLATYFCEYWVDAISRGALWPVLVCACDVLLNQLRHPANSPVRGRAAVGRASADGPEGAWPSAAAADARGTPACHSRQHGPAVHSWPHSGVHAGRSVAAPHLCYDRIGTVFRQLWGRSPQGHQSSIDAVGRRTRWSCCDSKACKGPSGRATAPQW